MVRPMSGQRHGPASPAANEANDYAAGNVHRPEFSYCLNVHPFHPPYTHLNRQSRSQESKEGAASRVYAALAPMVEIDISSCNCCG